MLFDQLMQVFEHQCLGFRCIWDGLFSDACITRSDIVFETWTILFDADDQYFMLMMILMTLVMVVMVTVTVTVTMTVMVMVMISV